MTVIASEARDERERTFSGRAGQLLTALSVAIAAGLVVLVGVRWYAYQWDFHMFYGAARDFAAGMSPYRGYGLSFFHPPIMLYVYRLFTFMPEYGGGTQDQQVLYNTIVQGGEPGCKAE